MNVTRAPREYEAIEFAGGGVARVVSFDVPQASLKPTEVEGWTVVSLVSPGTELAVYESELENSIVPGYAAVFRVESVGSEVHHLQPGQLVFGMGKHAAYQRLDADLVIPLPPDLAPETALFARLMAVSWTTLVTTRARPADPVLVIGLGVVGNLAAQILRAAGYRVTAVDPVEARRDRLSKTMQVLAAVPAASDGTDGFALVVDCSGHEDAVLAGARTARHGAEIVLIGVPWRQRSDAAAHTLLSIVFHRYLLLRSGWEWELPVMPTPFRAGSILSSLTDALSWLREGRIAVDGIARVVTPDSASDVFRALAAGTESHLTVLFDWESGR